MYTVFLHFATGTVSGPFHQRCERNGPLGRDLNHTARGYRIALLQGAPGLSLRR